jgi:hypothetical protein
MLFRGFGALPINTITTNVVTDTSTVTTPTTTTTTTATTSTAAPNPGDCDPTGQYIWALATDGTGYWLKLQPGQSCGQVIVQGTPLITEHLNPCDDPNNDTDPNNPCLITTSDGEYIPRYMPLLEVGPFKVPAHATNYDIPRNYRVLGSELHLPPDWNAFLVDVLSKDTGSVTTSMRDASPGHPYGALHDFIANLPNSVNQDYLVRAPGGFGTRLKAALTLDSTGKPVGTLQEWDAMTEDLSDFNPIAVTKHPTTGDDFGIYLWLTVNKTKWDQPWDSTTNPYELHFLWRKIDRHWYSEVWNFLKGIVSKLEDFFCSKISNPAVAGAMAKSPYGAAVVLGAGTICSSPSCSASQIMNPQTKQCVPKPPAMIQQPFYTKWWFIAGVVGITAFLVFKKSK